LSILVANKQDLVCDPVSVLSEGTGSKGHEQGDPTKDPIFTTSLLPSGKEATSTKLLLPLVCRETFQSVLLTSATTRHGLEDLANSILSLAGAPQVTFVFLYLFKNAPNISFLLTYISCLSLLLVGCHGLSMSDRQKLLYVPMSLS
jgi:hypothetical protein